jgi:hypothetical protein
VFDDVLAALVGGSGYEDLASPAARTENGTSTITEATARAGKSRPPVCVDRGGELVVPLLRHQVVGQIARLAVEPRRDTVVVSGWFSFRAIGQVFLVASPAVGTLLHTEHPGPGRSRHPAGVIRVGVVHGAAGKPDGRLALAPVRNVWFPPARRAGARTVLFYGPAGGGIDRHRPG